MTLAHPAFPTDRHGWAELLPDRSPQSDLTGKISAHWAVIGAGVTGLAAARRLAELHPDQDIVVLDARMVGQGASGRNSGFAVAVSQFNGGYDPAQKPEYQRVNRINQAGLEMLRDQVSALKIECQWQEEGFLHTAADEMAIRECEYFSDYLQGMEIPHTVLDQEELSGYLGTSLYRSGVRVESGALLQPAALVQWLADSLPENVTLYENSPVLSLAHGSPHNLILPEGEVSADKVILATNYEAGKIGFLKRYLIGSTLSGSFTRILTDDEMASLGSLSEWGALSLHGGGATVRLTRDRRICLRNAAEYHGSVLLSDDLLAQRQAIHRAGFDKRFPQLAHVPFEYAWSGVEGVSRNSTNFFGQQGEGVYLAGGYNGSGVSRGTAFGAALADYAVGGQSQLITDCLASAPGAWIPPRPFLDVGAFFKVRSRFRGVGLDR